MKTICKKTIVIGIILLLIGVSISSAISIDTQSTVSNNESEECRECKKVSKSDLIRVERLLNRVKVYSKLLKVLSRFNSELEEISEELSNEITSLKEEIKDDSPFPNICNILNETFYKFVDILEFLMYWAYSTEEGSFEHLIAILCYGIFYKTTYPIMGIIFVTGGLLGCWEIDPYPPHIS